MSEERQFLTAIRTRPDDRTTRLVYADWLEEHDDERGELIRAEEEARALPAYSDRYWELKPRRRQLLRSAKRPWLRQMGYGGTDYRPVFADVPAGWKARWRLIREFVERWYQIPMGDVGGPLKPAPRGRGGSVDREDRRTTDAAMSDPAVAAGLSPSLREWIFFIRDLQLGLADFGLGSGDRHIFWDSDGRVRFLQQDSGRDDCFVRDDDRHAPDPPAWWDRATPDPRRPSARSVAPHLTTLALHYLLTQHEPQFGTGPEPQRMTRTVARQLTDYFPTRSQFDDTQVFERENVIALLIPESLFTGDRPHLLVKVRPPANPVEVHSELWELDR